jgi:enoyl-CoA hydratase/carnithine racemase
MIRYASSFWHGAGNSFSTGIDIEDFVKNPPGPSESPEAQLIYALINFEKPLIVIVQGAAIWGRKAHVGLLRLRVRR